MESGLITPTALIGTGAAMGVTSKRMPWICSQGHKWEAVVANRIRTSGGRCPYCSGKRPIEGKTDLQTLHPDVAKEADGWNPCLVTIKSHKKLKWKCSKGHQWNSRVADRTPPESNGCPYCAGRLPIIGETDLLTLRPDVAAEADGWDPRQVTIGCNEKKTWVCLKGHRWSTFIYSRTLTNTGCPVCAGKVVHKGFNDLATLNNGIATEAWGWDPSLVTSGSNKKVEWRCKIGHIFSARIAERALSHSTDCPYCCGQKVLVQFNDLATLYPSIAAEAYGWDPKSLTIGSKKKLEWKCCLGHTWSAPVKDRTPPRSSGCPYCSGHMVWEGFNDLRTTHPELAEQALDWDPAKFSAGSGEKVKWICLQKHIWRATIGSRAAGNGCPECAESGFNPGKDAWFYLMQRHGEQQIGITNDLIQRMKQHGRSGWREIEDAGPYPGHYVQSVEKLYKKWLKDEIGTISGTTENWSTSEMEINSLLELKTKSGIETDLF